MLTRELIHSPTVFPVGRIVSHNRTMSPSRAYSATPINASAVATSTTILHDASGLRRRITPGVNARTGRGNGDTPEISHRDSASVARIFNTTRQPLPQGMQAYQREATHVIRGGGVGADGVRGALHTVRVAGDITVSRDTVVSWRGRAEGEELGQRIKSNRGGSVHECFCLFLGSRFIAQVFVAEKSFMLL